MQDAKFSQVAFHDAAAVARIYEICDALSKLLRVERSSVDGWNT